MTNLIKINRKRTSENRKAKKFMQTVSKSPLFSKAVDFILSTVSKKNKVNRGEKMEKQLFKRIGSILLVTALTLSVSACSANKPAANTSSASSAKATHLKLTLSTYDNWMTEDTTKIAIEMYEKETGNTISPQVYPEAQFISIMQTKMATGDVTDLVAINNVTPFTASEFTPLTGPWTSKLDKSKLYENGYGFDNTTVYGAPWASDSLQGLIYNKKIFKQAGITVPLYTYTDFSREYKDKSEMLLK